MPIDPSSFLAQALPSGGALLRALRLETPLGAVLLHWAGPWSDDRAPTGGGLVRLQLAADARDMPPAPPWLAAPFAAYFRDPGRRIDLPVVSAGTPLQNRVWSRISAIPCGETRTYGELAAALGSSARAVGGACRANPCPLVVPCHRVVAQSGLGGFAGDRDGRLLGIKRWLLAHEQAGAQP